MPVNWTRHGSTDSDTDVPGGNATRSVPRHPAPTRNPTLLDIIIDPQTTISLHLLFTYFFSLLALYLLHKNYHRFLLAKQTFSLARKSSTPARTVLVSSIPRALRSERALHEYFEHTCGWPVEAVQVVRHVGTDLRDAIREREYAMRQLERAWWVYQGGDDPVTARGRIRLEDDEEEEPSYPTSTREGSPSSIEIPVLIDDPEDPSPNWGERVGGGGGGQMPVDVEGQEERGWLSGWIGPSATDADRDGAGADDDGETSFARVRFTEEGRALVSDHHSGHAGRGVGGDSNEDDPEGRPVVDSSTTTTSATRMGKKQRDSTAAAAHRRNGPLKLSRDPWRPSGEAFVTFQSITSAELAAQVVHFPEHSQCRTELAPDPDDIVWANMGKSSRERLVRRMVVWAATAVILLFWIHSVISPLILIFGAIYFAVGCECPNTAVTGGT
ncbi:hypothetical protein QFC19_003984 [Naganishia cerealis]|uniref:Uncharacterized protein n=1 Tax=Naganishia cerealis TaxID=610337 RepID=A0ACC2W112_9TREE|nr:hypothetical protein QFC19_003984 [Naganishia cerealis]